MNIVGSRPNGRVPHLALHLPPEWVSDALCAQTDPEVFYPEVGGSVRRAKSVCAACPVLTECRDYALTTGELDGVWGGLSENDRRRIRRQARRTGTPAPEVGRDAA